MRTRVDDWSARLREVLSRYRTGPFVVGRCDCGTMWADAVLAVSGVDTLGDLRGRYRTHTGVLRLFKSLGVKDAYGLADQRFQSCTAAELHRGDLALINTGRSADAPIVSPAIVDTSAVFIMSPMGLVALPRAAIKRGWRV